MPLLGGGAEVTSPEAKLPGSGGSPGSEKLSLAARRPGAPLSWASISSASRLGSLAPLLPKTVVSSAVEEEERLLGGGDGDRLGGDLRGFGR